MNATLKVTAGPSARCSCLRRRPRSFRRSLHTWAMRLRREFGATLRLDGAANLIMAATLRTQIVWVR